MYVSVMKVAVGYRNVWITVTFLASVNEVISCQTYLATQDFSKSKHCMCCISRTGAQCAYVCTRYGEVLYWLPCLSKTQCMQ